MPSATPQDGVTTEPTAILRNLHAVFPSVAMLAGVQLGVFTALKNGPLSAAAMAGVLDVHEEKLAPLLYALVVADLLRVSEGVFSNTAESVDFLVQGCPTYLGGLVEFYAMLWDMIRNTGKSIATGTPQARFDFQALSEEELAAYFRKQIHSSRKGGEDIARVLDFSQSTRLLDAGGGTGGTAMAICETYPHLLATVADLPTVTRLAAGFIDEAGLSGRMRVAAADLRVEVPEGTYDTVLLRAVLQTFSQEDALRILANVGRAMQPGGKIIVAGSILDDSRLGPMSSLAYSLVFLNTYDAGCAYTEGEYRQMLEASGFTDVTVTLEALPDGMGIVTAVKS